MVNKTKQVSGYMADVEQDQILAACFVLVISHFSDKRDRVTWFGAGGRSCLHLSLLIRPQRQRL